MNGFFFFAFDFKRQKKKKEGENIKNGGICVSFIRAWVGQRDLIFCIRFYCINTIFILFITLNSYKLILVYFVKLKKAIKIEKILFCQ